MYITSQKWKKIELYIDCLCERIVCDVLLFVVGPVVEFVYVLDHIKRHLYVVAADELILLRCLNSGLSKISTEQSTTPTTSWRRRFIEQALSPIIIQYHNN